MCRRLYIDIETRGVVDLTKVGSWVYSRHPTTDAMCIAYAIDSGPVQLIAGNPVIDRSTTTPLEFTEAVLSDCEVWAHNAQFERHHWVNVFVTKLGWQPIEFDRWRCSAAQAARWGLPRSLENAAHHLRLADKKDKVGNKLMLKLSKPRRTKSKEIQWHENPDELQRLYEYCKQDVEVERQIATKLPELEPEELAFWRWIEELNDYGIYTDQELVDGIIKVVAELTERDLTEFRQLTDDQVGSPTQRDALLEWLEQEDCFLPDLQARTVQDVLDADRISARARLALEARQNLSRSSLAKLNALKLRADTDDCIRGHLLYFGAHTGRLSGRGVQTQNLPAAGSKKIKKQIEPAAEIFKTGDLALCETVLSDVRKVGSLCIRSALRARPERVLIANDYAAIEARGLLWVADAEQLQILREGRNLYIEMAQQLYGRPIHKTKDPLEYDMGKRAILGLGYGMGPDKFIANAKKYGVVVPYDFAEKTVKTYREWMTAVPEFWRTLERAFFRAIAYGRVELSHNMRVEYRQRCLRWYLPSGRPIIYWYPTIIDQETSWGALKPQIQAYVQGRPTKLYGGLLTENGVQALCRDLLRDAALRIRRERPEYKAVLTVHDELVFEVPQNDADLDWVSEQMCIVPPWAEGMPIADEGWVGEVYKK